MTKNIFFFFQHYAPFPGAGARRAESILENYDFDDHHATLITTTEGLQARKFNRKTVKSDAAGNKRTAKLRAWSEILLGFRVAIYLLMQKHIDGIVISIPSYLASIPIAVCVWGRHIPYVLEVRDVYPETFAEAKLISKNNFLYRLLERYTNKLYNDSLGIIVPTEGAKEYVLNYTHPDKINMIYNGFNKSLSRKEKFEKFTVCFHGVLGEFQDVFGLKEIAKLLKKAGLDFIVIGYGKKEILLNNADGITFLGRRSPEETLDIVSKCHFGISLRTNDQISKNAFPVKIWEYIGMNIPCIVSPKSEAGDFLEINSLGAQFDCGAYGEIVQKIIEYKSNAWHIKNNIELHQFNRQTTGCRAANVIYNYFEKN